MKLFNTILNNSVIFVTHLLTDEVYAVLLQWRRRERDNATKRKLIGMLRDFCDEIDYCEWEFLEKTSNHGEINIIHAHNI